MHFSLPTKKAIIPIAILTFATIVFFTTYLPISFNTILLAPTTAFAQNALLTKELEQMSSYTGLPVASVKVFPSSASNKRIAIYVPQYHINPADNNPTSSANSDAVTAQQQIYQIEKFLLQKSGSTFIMDEGEYYNNVDPTKTAILSQKISLFNSLDEKEKQLQQAEQTDPQNAQELSPLISSLESTLSSLSKEIILTDAAHVLKAEGNKFDIVGVEDTTTMNKAKDLVRDYVYIQDRLTQVEASNQQENAATLPYQTNTQNSTFSAPVLGTQSQGFNPMLLMQNPQVQKFMQTNPRVAQLLQMVLGEQQTQKQPSFTMLEQTAQNQGNTELAKLLTNTEHTYSSLTTLEQQQQSSAMQAAQSAPTRTNNPYTNITDVNLLKKMLVDAQKKLIPVVVDQRNAETAQHFSQTLAQRKQHVGIIQFGAGHENGMIQDLNKEGITVVEVMPAKVEQLHATQGAQESIPA